MSKVFTGLFILFIIGAGAYWYMRVNAPIVSIPSDSDRAFAWNMTEIGEHPSVPGMPRTGITLTAGGKTYPIGEFDGSCAEIDGTSWTLADGEKTGVICWFAGGGSEVGVFEENGMFVVKVGHLDEGDAETPGFRGGYQTILTLE